MLARKLCCHVRGRTPAALLATLTCLLPLTRHAAPAGSMLLRAVLSASLPNFLHLLAADYRRWAGLAGTGDAAARQLDAPVGELFSDAAAAVQEGRQRREAQAHVQGEAAAAPAAAAARQSDDSNERSSD